MKKSGIYIIQSTIEPEKFYIGSSVNLQNRKRQHYSMLKLNKHDATFLSSKNIEDIKIKMLNLTGKHGELKELSKELNIPYSKLIDIKRNKTWVNHGM